jgi:phosphoribosylaminoimidazole carboxylase/phosphoribosylaminoimidazole-succinocarboxamide synthase
MSDVVDRVQAALSREPIAVGKTKTIYPYSGDYGSIIAVAKDDITAGDGAKHDVIPGKAKWSTETTCNVFRLLKSCKLPVAFEDEIRVFQNQNEFYAFTAPRCEMLPFEVVVRREAHGSYLKRRPYLQKGHLFPELLVEFFLKTKGKKWGNHGLPCDDPLIEFSETGGISLFEPGKPIANQSSFLFLREDDSPCGESYVAEMSQIARRAFLVLERAWQILGRQLVDFKVEFGITREGKLLLADVIDNDSWRVLNDGQYIDKQVYRDGGSLDEVARKYAEVAELTGRFQLPHQKIFIWTGSDKDDIGPFTEAFNKYGCTSTVLDSYTCSVHKEPVKAVNVFRQTSHLHPNLVTIAYVGRSNGAGPVLSAAANTPVITVPAGYKEFPDDIWSSLRTPSDVPVMTILDPANAMLAALTILSLNNPELYMILQERIESRSA